MRVPTAVTIALTVLLTVSLSGAVAAAPAAADPTSEFRGTSAATDRSLSPAEGASPSLLSAGHRFRSTAQSPAALTAIHSTAPLERPDPKQVIRLTVRDDGDVEWTIESRFLLTDEEDEQIFANYSAEVVAGERNVEYDTEQYEPVRRTAQQATGREMSIEDGGWNEPRIVESPTAEQLGPDAADEGAARIGVISYSFTWTNFATVEDDRIHFGDAFRTSSGTWMELTPNQRLRIEPQPNYALETPTKLTWDGPYEFTADELEIVFVRTGNGGGGNGGNGGVDPGSASGLFSGWILAGLVGIVGVGIGGYLLFRRDDRIGSVLPVDRLRSLGLLGIGDRADGEAEATGDGSESVAGTAGGAAAVPTDSSAPEDGGTDGTAFEFKEPVDDEIDPELLSDEERVLRLLKQNGGRMKQASIVSETGWSNAKVSQLLSKMDDDDEIEKLRIGRENLITLPGVDPTELD